MVTYPKPLGGIVRAVDCPVDSRRRRRPAGNYAGSRCRGLVAPGVLTTWDFRCTLAGCSVCVLMSIAPVDYEDIGDNSTLSQLSRGHCQDARITFGPLSEGCDRDLGMMEARAAIAKTTVAPERRRLGRLT